MTTCSGERPVVTEHRLPVVETFADYYRRDYRSVLGLAFVLAGDRGVAEDLVQDAMVEAHRRWDTISGYDDPGAWVRRVLVNKRISRSRRLTSESKMLKRIGSRRQSSIVQTERTMEVWEAVRRLPQRQGQAIALRYWEDLSISQIAHILECSTETVKTHLKRGRASLAMRLGDLEGEDRS